LPSARQGTALVFLVLLLLVTAGVGAQGWAVYPGLLFTEVVLLLLPTLAACRRLDLSPRQVLGLRNPTPGRPLPAVAAGAGIGVLSFAMALGLTYPAIMLLLLLGGRHPGLPLPLSGPVDLLWALAIGAVVAPICEELLFRGFLQSSLRSYGLHAMVWIAAVCFGLFHLDPLRFLPTTALGVVYGYLAASSRSVYPAVAAHGTNNLIALVLGYLGGGGGVQPALTYEAIEKQMIQQFAESGMPVNGLAPEQMVLVGVLASMALMLAAGVALAVLVGFILRGLTRRAAALGEPGAAAPAGAGTERGELPAAMGTISPEPGAGPRADGPALPEAGDVSALSGGRRPVSEILGIPWVAGIAAIAVLFWGLGIWSYFAPAAEQPGSPEPAGVQTEGERAGAGDRQRGRGINIAPEPKLLGIVRGEVTESWSLSVASVPASESVPLSPFYTR
jgi:membrane protease YdiL (CAAX protease family)